MAATDGGSRGRRNQVMTIEQQKANALESREKNGGEPSDTPKRVEYLTAKQLA